MDFKSLQKKIKAKEFEPIYVLHGDESFYIDKLVDLFEIAKAANVKLRLGTVVKN